MVRLRAVHLDFVSALDQASCLDAIRSGISEINQQTLTVNLRGGKVWITSVWGADARGRPSSLWLFRFEGELTTTIAGTLIHGRIRRNLALEAGLALTWCSVALAGGLSLLLDPVVAVLISPLMVLLSGFYMIYLRSLRRQARELLGWIETWLLLPRGRASEPLPP